MKYLNPSTNKKGIKIKCDVCGKTMPFPTQKAAISAWWIIGKSGDFCSDKCLAEALC